MSQIDTITHSYVGQIAGLPLYHPIDNIEDEDLYATPQNLVIGGGSGEHPALVIKNLDVCAWDFLNFLANTQNKDTDNIKFFTQWDEELTEEEQNIYYYHHDNFTYHWPMNTVANFTNKVKDDFDQAIKYLKNEEIKNIDVEIKLNIMIGEFIYFNAPHLLSDKLQAYLKDMKSELKKEDIEEFGILMAIKILPKGYPLSSGKYIAEKNGENRTVWGLRFDEEHLVDLSLNQYQINKNKSKNKVKI